MTSKQYNVRGADKTHDSMHNRTTSGLFMKSDGSTASIEICEREICHTQTTFDPTRV